mmetsp:Transcript_10933/g.34802  ORF Transcript_10933/g.34802 Transcript_10933/m.34802 type:complete len:282 (+) Transcript_10933:4418-5263(+)
MRPQGDANGAGCAANLPCLRRAGAAAGAALRRGVRVALLLPVPQGAPLARVRKGACLRRHLLRRRGDGACAPRSGRAVAAELLLQHCARVGDAGPRGGRRARRCKAARPADASHRRLLRGDSAQAGRAGRVAARRQGGGLVRGVDPSPCRGGGARGARKRLERAADGRGCGGRRARAASARQEARPREGVRAERDDVGGLRRVRQVAEGEGERGARLDLAQPREVALVDLEEDVLERGARHAEVGHAERRARRLDGGEGGAQRWQRGAGQPERGRVRGERR